MRNDEDIDQRIASAQEELERLDSKREALLVQIDELKQEKAHLRRGTSATLADMGGPTINNQSSEDEKISLFRVLFKGREDVYAMRYESVRTGKAGYFPAYRMKREGKLREKLDGG